MPLSKTTVKAIRELGAQDKWENADIKRFDDLSREIVEQGYCPSCLVNDGIKNKLGPWEPGNTEQYAGRSCYVCEDFFPCGEQPEYNDEPDCFSDADPGL